MICITTISSFIIVADNNSFYSKPYPAPASEAYPGINRTDLAVGSLNLGDTVEAISNPGSYTTIVNYVFVLWLLGVLIFSINNLVGWGRTRHLVAHHVFPVTDYWQSRFNRLCRKFNIGQKVRLIQSKLVPAPCLVGWLKPIILVPAGTFTGLNPNYVEMILAHELAHLRNHDILINYLQIFAETLLFFNPAVWWVSRQIRTEREHRCDDFVITEFGDRIIYAHALTELESFRFARLKLAMAADGGSLFYRIKRLIKRPNESRNRKSTGAAIVAAASLLIVIGACVLSGTGSNMVHATQALPDGVVIPPPDYDLKGTWEAEWYGDEITFQMHYYRFGSNTMRAWQDEVIGIEKAEESRFMLIRDGGTFYFDGGFDKIGNESLGSGTYYFVENPEYLKELAKIGYTNSFLGINFDSKKEVMQMTISNLSFQYAREMKGLGYDDISLDRLTELFYHGVRPDYIRSLADEGYKNLHADMLQKMRDHGVDAVYIRTLKRMGYSNISTAELVKYRDHGVDGSFLAGLARYGYDDLTLDEARKMRDHGVDAGYISAMAEYGFDDLPASELVKLRDHGVTPSFIEELKSAGYDDLPPSTLRKMKDHGVDGLFISSLHRYEYKDLPPSMLIKMRDHGVDSYYISSLKDLGYCCLKPSLLIKMKDHGVSPDFIERANEDYGRKLDPKRLIRMRDRGY
jgi:beta-lactamase regulating signal transducer with metallopeptidase domain/methylmalonyl-CoA mutase cobalamin-binding subunit